MISMSPVEQVRADAAAGEFYFGNVAADRLRMHQTNDLVVDPQHVSVPHTPPA
jgi:hypothetical protein